MYLEDFTNEEKERINQLYGNDFAETTYDDIQLIIRWEYSKGVHDGANSEEARLMREKTQADIDKAQAEADLARAEFEALVNKAKARYEEVSDNGK